MEKIKDAIVYHHYKDLKENINKYKKLESVKHQDFREMQPYFKDKSIDKCRTKFRLRTEMLQSFKDNFRNNYRTLNKGQEEDDPGLICQDCKNVSSPARDSQVHCLTCPAWSHLREDLDMTDIRCIEDMVVYFQRVLRAREEKDDKEKKRRKKEREENESKLRKEGLKRKRGQ
jgi:hypothetical protein